MTYPQAPDQKIQKISNLLVRYAESKGYQFTYYEEDVYPVEAFAHFGGLALFALEAKEHYEKIYNKLYSVEELVNVYDKQMFAKKKDFIISDEDKARDNEYLEKQSINKKFGIELVEQEDKTYFGFIVRISPDIEMNFSTFSHLFMYALDNYVKEYQLKNNLDNIDKPIPLDELYNKMINKINNDKIIVLNKDTANILYSTIDSQNLNKNIENI